MSYDTGIIFLAAMLVIDGIAIAYSMYRFYNPRGTDEEWEEQETQFKREELDL